jgi:hypothetical protein
MKPADILKSLRAALGDYAPPDLDHATVSFVADDELLYLPHEVLTHRSKLRGADERAFWSELLDQPRSWIHANLMIDSDGNPVVSLRPGPRVAPQPGLDTPVNVSLERLPLRVLE